MATGASPHSLPRPTGGAAGGYSPAPPQDMCGRPAGQPRGGSARCQPPGSPAVPTTPAARAARTAARARFVYLSVRARGRGGCSAAARPLPPLPLPPGKCSSVSSPTARRESHYTRRCSAPALCGIPQWPLGCVVLPLASLCRLESLIYLGFFASSREGYGRLLPVSRIFSDSWQVLSSWSTLYPKFQFSISCFFLM